MDNNPVSFVLGQLAAGSKTRAAMVSSASGTPHNATHVDQIITALERLGAIALVSGQYQAVIGGPALAGITRQVLNRNVDGS